MHKYLKKFIGFMFGFVLIFGALSIAYEWRIRLQDNFNTQYARFTDEQISPSVLFLGDSRVVYGLRHSEMGNEFFNYAYFAENYRLHFLRLVDALKLKPKVKYVVIPMDLHSISKHRDNPTYSPALLFSSMSDVREVYDAHSFIQGLEAHINYRFPILETPEFVKLIKASYGDIKAVIDKTKRNKSKYFDQCLELKISPMHDWSSFAGEERINKATTNAERKLKGKSFDEGVYQAALKLINYAKNNGITVIGVKYPTTIEYQMAAKRVADINITKQYKYFPVDYVLDYEALLSHQPNLFHDADHLNDVGARLFSRRIAKDISKIAMSLDDSLKVQPIEQWQCEGHYPSQATPGTSAWSAINRWAS